MVIPSCCYDSLSGKVERRFVEALNAEMCGVQDRWWNLGQFIVFQTVILQQVCHITAYHVIQRRIKKSLDAYYAGRHGILMEETLYTCYQYFAAVRREESQEHWDKTYHSLVFREKLWTTVLCITEQETGGVMQPVGN